MRPQPLGNAWALIIVAVAVVIFIGLVVWVAGGGWTTAFERPTDHEAVFRLARQWEERWSQVPGPPERYLEEAAVADRERKPTVALERLQMSLALDPDNPDALLRYTILSSRVGGPDALSPEQCEAIIEAVEDTTDDPPLLPAARAWLALRRDDPVQVLEILGPGPTGLEARQARLRALGALGENESGAAAAVLALDPGNDEACAVSVRGALAEGRLDTVVDLADRCEAAGADPCGLARFRAEVADVAGRYKVAIEAYLLGGNDLHALAVASQEDPAHHFGHADLLTVDPTDPAAALHLTWAGLLRSDRDLVSTSLERVQDAGVAGPEFTLAEAAALLALDRPAEALDRLANEESASARVLAGRAYAALGQEGAARTAFDAAVALRPWLLDVHRERLAFLAAHGDAAEVDAALREMLAQDPIETLVLANGYRQRDVPWPALAPSPWPVDRLDAQAAGDLAAVLHGTFPADDRLPACAWAALRSGPATPPSARAALVAAVAADDDVARLVEAWLLDPTADAARIDALLAGTDLSAEHPMSAGYLRARALAARGNVQEADDLLTSLIAQRPELVGLVLFRSELGHAPRSP